MSSNETNKGDRMRKYGIEDVRCPLQKIVKGIPHCHADSRENSDWISKKTDVSNFAFCASCPAGRIFRELGCNRFDAEVNFVYFGSQIARENPRVFCKARSGMEVTFEDCERCNDTGLELLDGVFSTSSELLQRSTFKTSYRHFVTARRALHEKDYDATIRASVSMLESALKQCQLSLSGTSEGDTLTKLWKPTAKLLELDDVGGQGLYDIGNHLSSIIFAVAGLRNQWSDAHGKVDESKKHRISWLNSRYSQHV